MKIAFYALIILGLYASCKSNGNRPAIDSTSEMAPANYQGGNLVKKFGPLVQGVWVKKDYINKIVRTKSPLAASVEANDLTTIFFNINEIKGDSLVASAGVGNHEGSEMVLKFRPGKAPSTIQFGGGDLGYTIEKGDTILFYSRFDDEQKKTITTKYVKALKTQPKNDLGYGMNYMINKTLISGKYVGTDTLSTILNVKFLNDGTVSGISDLKTFFIEDDLGNEPLMNVDGIIFNFNTKKYRFYSFKITADTLSLYDTHSNDDSTKLILGKRVYKLIKQK